MAQSLSQVHLHIVFSTKYREHTIKKEFRNDLYNYMGRILYKNNCQMKAIGGTANHVHILTVFSRTISISKILQRVKGKSSKWVNQNALGPKYFRWQKGYGVFSVSISQIERVTRYIKNQERHHRTMIFQEELIGLLEKHNVDYDERYLWD